jgi:two-component system response regulator FlrC
VRARFVIACAGLHSDRVAALTGGVDDLHVVPFRGDYYTLRPEARRYCRGLIYPLPDPHFPFLGVHLTRRIDGEVWAGPNAVLAFRREGYRLGDVSLRDVAETLAFPGFRRLARTYLRTGLAEMWRGLSKAAFVRALQRYVPAIQASDLVYGPTGVRAQALRADGALVDDFVLGGDDRVLHVRNAPSPGATASLAIGRELAERAAERFSLRALSDRAREEAGSHPPLGYGSAAMEPVVAALRKVAPTQATVLLLGESGTGKEVAARAVHAWSPRSDGPFVAINCAAVSETLLEAELFGHEKGAFTGATATRRGRLELAAGGTFFLDEIAELRPELQVKLLRVLQEKRFERVGGSRTIEADVRWIAATNRDLDGMLASGRLRDDLSPRLAVFPVRMPPLRERRDDILPLADRLLAEIAADLGRPAPALSEDAREAIAGAGWPGNIRELRNALERASILTDDGTLTADLLAARPASGSTAAPARPSGVGAAAAPADPDGSTLEEIERRALARALARHDGHRQRAAEELGIGLRTLYDKIKKYGL